MVASSSDVTMRNPAKKTSMKVRFEADHAATTSAALGGMAIVLCPACGQNSINEKAVA
jgi:hypothetical protein